MAARIWWPGSGSQDAEARMLKPRSGNENDENIFVLVVCVFDDLCNGFLEQLLQYILMLFSIVSFFFSPNIACYWGSRVY